MIRGSDIVIPRSVKADDKEIILQVIRDTWPDALIEHGILDEAPLAAMQLEPSKLPSEALVYRDEAALIAWSDEGWTDQYADSMIHILIGTTTITCVVDLGENSETRTIAERIKQLVSGEEEEFHEPHA